MTIVDDIMSLFARRGAVAYHGEAVSQTEHALQAAELRLSKREHPTTLIVAALLHDVGHLLDGQDEDLAARGLDGRHEEAGCAWLAEHFGPEQSLSLFGCTSPPSVISVPSTPAILRAFSLPHAAALSLQGGPMTTEEIADFESNPSTQDAVRLRHWDDTAKVPGLNVPGLDHYRERLSAPDSEISGFQAA